MAGHKKWSELVKKYKLNKKSLAVCSLTQPLYISIPPGETIHIDCNVHPEGHDVDGTLLWD